MANEVNSIGNIPVAQHFRYNPDPYFDVEDMDISYSTYPMYGMGMGESIFGMGMMPMCGMGGNQNYFDNMKDYQKFYIDYNVDQQKMQRNADMRINGSMEAVQATYNTLKDKIKSNEQGQIIEAYNNYVAAVRTAYGEGTEQEVRARAAALFTQMNGKPIAQELRENGHGSFTQGALHAMTLGLYDSKSVEDNISQITGAPVGTGEKTKQNLGRLTGAGIVGAVAGGIAHACKSGKAGIIGLAAAGVAGLMSIITGKVTT